ncbi:MAG: hypothetical protein V1754_04510, partial [Pseudomonadota bacterium]
MNIEFPLFWIPLLPLLGAAFNLLLGRKFSRSSVHAVACGSVLAALVVSLWAVFFKLWPAWKAATTHAAEVGTHAVAQVPPLVNNMFDWIGAGSVSISMGLICDPLTAVMILVVTGVGFLIHVYST